jgi:predicted amidohydrolase
LISLLLFSRLPSLHTIISNLITQHRSYSVWHTPQLRYPEPALSLKRLGAQLITYSSAFTVPTGKAHWELLLRARAIETQSYIVAAAQAGQHNEKHVTYGHSIIVGPWGEVLAELGGEFKGPEIATATVDLSYVVKIRRELPLRRRWDVYAELWGRLEFRILPLTGKQGWFLTIFG